MALYEAYDIKLNHYELWLHCKPNFIQFDMDYPGVDPKSQPLDDLMSSTPGSRMIPIHGINSLLRDRCSGLRTFCHLFPALLVIWWPQKSHLPPEALNLSLLSWQTSLLPSLSRFSTWLHLIMSSINKAENSAEANPDQTLYDRTIWLIRVCTSGTFALTGGEIYCTENDTESWF